MSRPQTSPQPVESVLNQPPEEASRRLLHVRYAAAAVDECLFSLRETVRQARSAGVSWSQIGEALGIAPKEAAHQYGP